MPVVAFPVLLFAVGAMICYLLAQPIVRSMFVSAAEAVPIVGKYMARGALAIEARMIDLFKSYVWGSTVTFVHWLVGLAQNIAGNAKEIRGFAADVADALDHLVSKVIPGQITDALRNVNKAIGAAQTDATSALTKITSLTNGLKDTVTPWVNTAIAAIWATVHSIANIAHDSAVGEAERYAERLAGGVAQTVDGVAGRLGDLERNLGDLVNPRTAAEAAIALSAAAGVATLVETQIAPLVRDLAECTPKLKATCQTDMSEWLGLLEGLVLAGSLPSLIELARAAQAAVGDFTGDAASLVGIDGGANVPSHPSGWA